MEKGISKKNKFLAKCAGVVGVLGVVCVLGFITGGDKKLVELYTDILQKAKRSSTTPSIPPPDPLKFPKAAVAADHKTCSTHGKEALLEGGHAVDAAIVTALCVGVINAHSAGIGGGGFMVIYDRKTKKSTAIDFRETAPAALVSNSTEDMLSLLHKMKLREIQANSPSEALLVGVPGELRGFEKAWKKYGKLPWRRLFKPAIELCKKGFKVHPSLAVGIAKNSVNVTNSNLRLDFTRNGKVLVEGDIVKRKEYGDTLKKIANSGGADIFYNGTLSKTVVKDIEKEGGVLTLKDLQNYEARDAKPVIAHLNHFNGSKLVTLPPPSGGGVVLANILQILSGFNFTAADMRKNPGLTYHRIIEACKYAHAGLTFLGDPSYMKDSDKADKMLQVVEDMINPQKAEEIRKRIDNKTHKIAYYGPINYNPAITDGTTHLSVVDEEGNGVSLTTSINKYFGSKIRSKKLGIIYNDQLADAMNHWVNEYGLVPDAFKPGRRPLSLACPAILVDKHDKLQMVIGAAGGRYIPTTLAQVIMNYYWFGYSLKDAVAKPRLHAQLFPEMVLVEENFSPKLIKEIKKFGHRYLTNDTTLFTGTPKQIMGVVQLVEKKKNTLLALADYRKGGVADGYK